MIAEFEHLTSEEQTMIYSTPVLVAILIAGADGKIDKSEMREAISISKLKKKRARKDLIEYYQQVGEDFEDKLMVGINKYPTDPHERQTLISEELKMLNKIIPKLDKKFALKYYESLKDFAKRIAEASGGVLGYMSIGYEESKLIELKMIKDPRKR
jgi:hypothetical protein